MADPFDFERQRRFAVMGNPVSHSKSPFIHKQFAHQFKHNLEYTAIQVDIGGLPQAVDQFRAHDGNGLNITVPFKLDAFRLAEHRSDRAEIAQAVNTLRFEKDGSVFGDNTDGAGLVHDIQHNLNINIKDKQVLILGAGGAVRGVLAPILKHNPARLLVANRTVAKAKALVREFASHGKLEVCEFEELRGKHFDIVVNGTSASLQGEELPPLPETLLARGALAYDMMYADRATPFMEWALLHNAAKVADGIGMLVEQAAESYFVWNGVRPQTSPVIAALRKGV
ncbi:MAG TPA: shikimate dehydrogenase [Burkholderiales bacterium]|nr:shikimate dehydrogenase [Burkholderiales bacterium]